MSRLFLIRLLFYFQIRFQEIGGALESACSKSVNESIESSSGNSDFHLKPFNVGYSCIKKSWSTGVYLPQLFVRFFKLTLQIFARLAKWSEEVIVTKELPSNLDRIDFLVLVYLDLTQLSKIIPKIFDSIVEQIPFSLNTELPLVEKCFDDTKKMLSDRLKQIEEKWSSEIIAQTSGWTKQVADIPRLYRKTNRDAPSKPCNYVEQLLKPVKSFNEKNSSRISSAIIRQCLILIISHLNQQ